MGVCVTSILVRQGVVGLRGGVGVKNFFSTLSASYRSSGVSSNVCGRAIGFSRGIGRRQQQQQHRHHNHHHHHHHNHQQQQQRHLHSERSGRGKGPPVICMPGALGTGQTDFGPQLLGLGTNNNNRRPSLGGGGVVAAATPPPPSPPQEEEEGRGDPVPYFDVIACDPEGYGGSRPPSRSFDDFVDQDAHRAAALMQELGHETYGVLGWSDGGNSAAALAGLYPERVNRLVVWGGNAYVTQEDIDMYAATADLSTWSERMRAPLEAVYGDDLQRIWTDWNAAMVTYLERHNGNLIEHHLKSIKCPTLVLHGERDPMVPPHHPRHLVRAITDARLLVFPEGKHNIHLKYADDFNRMVGAFLVDPATKNLASLTANKDTVYEEDV